MSVNLKLTFGQKVPNVEYTTTQLAVLLTKERIKNTIGVIKEKTGLAALPTLLIELPSSFAEVVTKSAHMDSVKEFFGLSTTVLNAGSKVFVCGELTEGSDFLKSIENSFKEITDLENDIELKLDLTEPSSWADNFNKGHPAPTIVLEGAQISGHVATDPKLLGVLHNIFEGVCPEFNQSPIMAALQLFELIEVDLKFHTFKIISDRFWQKFEAAPKDFKTTDPYVKELLHSKEEMFMYFTLPDLCCVKFRTPCNLMGSILVMLEHNI